MWRVRCPVKTATHLGQRLLRLLDDCCLRLFRVAQAISEADFHLLLCAERLQQVNILSPELLIHPVFLHATERRHVREKEWLFHWLLAHLQSWLHKLDARTVLTISDTTCQHRAGDYAAPGLEYKL